MESYFNVKQNNANTRIQQLPTGLAVRKIV